MVLFTGVRTVCSFPDLEENFANVGYSDEIFYVFSKKDEMVHVS